MSIQKINIVLFGPGKVGSQLVSQILKNQSLFLEEGKDIRISLVLSSSLAFIENDLKKNAWDVTFMKSSKNERIANIVSYIQDNNFVNTIIVDATKQSDVPYYYSYFLQNGLYVVSLNSDVKLFSQRRSDEIKIRSEVYDRKFYKLDDFSVTKEQVVEFAFQNILSISKNVKQTKAVKQAI